MANTSNFGTAGFGVPLFGPQQQTVSSINPLTEGLNAGAKMASGLSSFVKDPYSAAIVGGVSAVWGLGKGLISKKKMITENKDFANQFMAGQQLSQDNLGSQLAMRSVNMNRGYLTNSSNSMLTARKGAKLVPRKKPMGIPAQEDKSSDMPDNLKEMLLLLLTDVASKKAMKKKSDRKPPMPTKADTDNAVPAIPKHRSGGTINIIPKGVMHARKNNIGDKGIPIVTEGEGTEVTKVAEIELNEIIFTKELTVKVEGHVAKFEADPEDKENLLELGRLLKDEILNNTKDCQGDLL